jgi:hypothetical protein
LFLITTDNPHGDPFDERRERTCEQNIGLLNPTTLGVVNPQGEYRRRVE